MSKFLNLMIFLLLNIFHTVDNINSSLNSINSTNNIRNLKSYNKKNYFFNNKIVKLFLVIGSLILGIIGGIIYVIRYYGFDPVYNDWEYFWRRRNERKRKEREILKKKKKYYLLNNEIKGFKYKKENCNNEEEECPICLENYSDEKKVCFTPCKHLFHHICLKEYIYGCDEMKCPICKFDMWNCLKDKKINYSKIKIKEEIFQIKKNSKKNKNNLINSNNVTLNNERDSLNIS